jgi:RHS repeat-associated protein
VSGSLASANLPAALTSATYNANNQLTQWGSTNLSYDLNGSMTSDGTTTHTWNARNELSAFGSTSFSYDAFRRRIQNASGKAFLYDCVNAVQELSGSTVTANLLGGFGVDEIFSRTDSAGVRNFLTDALGSTVGLTDSSGTLQAQYSYEPFGKTTASGASTTNTFQFTSRENDGNGLYYYRARYYNPTLQRFVSEDPIGFLGGDANLYAHVGNDATDLIDPSGKSTITDPNFNPFGPLWPWPLPPGGGVGGGGGGGGAGGARYDPEKRKRCRGDLVAAVAAGLTDVALVVVLAPYAPEYLAMLKAAEFMDAIHVLAVPLMIALPPMLLTSATVEALIRDCSGR